MSRDPKTGMAIVADEKIGVHRTHCCKKHGCKYGGGFHDSACPVYEGFETQKAGCEYCHYEDQAREKALDVLTEKMNEHMRESMRRRLPPEHHATLPEDFFRRGDFEREVDILLDAGLLDVDL